MQTLEDTVLAVEGYFDDRDDYERMLRRHANFCVSPYVDKGFMIEKYWTIRGDEVLKQQKTSEERHRAKLLRFKQLEAQRKANANQT